MSKSVPTPTGLPVCVKGAHRRRGEPACASASTSLFAAAAFAALAIASVAFAGEYHSNPWLLSWIPATCCVTNDCCWQVTESELKSLPDDNWEVMSTGQVRKRTDYSPDGKFYRCACDFDADSRHWIRHQGANTRCIFVPMRTAGL